MYRNYFDMKLAFLNQTRPAWAGFKTAEEGITKIMLIYT